MTSPFSTFCFLSRKTNRFHIAVGLYSSLKDVKNVAKTPVTQSASPCVPLFCSYHIMNVSCDLLLNRSTAKLSKLCGEKIANKELKKGPLPITGGEIHEKSTNWSIGLLCIS